MSLLRGRAAIVTGASQGFGQAIATRLVRDGADVVITARNSDPLVAAWAELVRSRRESAQRVEWIATDVSQPDAVQRLVEFATQTLGRIDVLVCNAGVYGPMGRLPDVDWDAWARAIEINLFGTVLCCRAVLPVMYRQHFGKIITVSGGGATQPLPHLSAYAASKAAVVRFTETLAEETRGTGIDVNAIAPGALNTRLLDEVLAAGPERVGSVFYERSVRQKNDGGTPLTHGANLVAFLASSESDGITGRLISAVWDDWRGLPARRAELESSDVYTLRRIVPSDRGWEQPP